MIPDPYALPKSAITKEFVADQIRSFNEEVIRKGLIAPDRIYMDLEMIKDLFVGRILLSPQMSSDLYKRILDMMPEYRARSTFGYTFPVEPAQEPNPDQLMRIAPPTEFLSTWIPDYFARNANHSAVLNKKGIPVVMDLNTYPLRFSALANRQLIRHFSDTFGVGIALMCIDPKTISVQKWLSYDDVFTFRPKEGLLCREDVRQAYSDMQFQNKRLFVPQLVESGEISSDNSVGEAAWMGCLTYFQFLPASSVSPAEA